MARRAVPRLAFSASLLAVPTAARATEPAELVLRNAVVHTMDPKRPSAEAVAVRGNRIVAVGSEVDVQPFIAKGTRVLDLGGRTVVPGFEDSHAHFRDIGFARLDVDLVGTRSYAEVVERVATALKGRPLGEWIRGRGWHEGKWTAPPPGAVRGFPTHEALDAISPGNPVVLERADGHAILANARAMALIGLSRATTAPEGGEIVRDANGDPTGVFVDNATALVQAPERAPDEVRRAIELATRECLEKGVTSLTDAGAETDVLALYREAVAAGKLHTRLYVMAAGLTTMRALGRPEMGSPGSFLTVRAVKAYADGALGSRGAALLEPYSDDPGNSGLLVTPPGELLETARFALAHGFQMATHAIGDRANRVVLDAYEKALGEHPEVKDPRLRIEHAQVLDAADIPRFGRLGVLVAFQGIHCPSDRPWAPKRLGEARVEEGAYVWRKLLETGARLMNGTDAPVEDVSPIQNLHATVTRQDANGQPPGGFDPEQKLTRDEALRTMTLDPAFGSFAEAEKGSIEAGKLADLVVLSQDILSVPDDALMDTEVLATIVDGTLAYEKPGSPLGGSPRRPEGRPDGRPSDRS
jgi:predicted amidohydrolase YtcJ